MELPRPSDGDIIRALDINGKLLCEGPIILDYAIDGGYVAIALDRSTGHAHGFVLEEHIDRGICWWQMLTNEVITLIILEPAVGFLSC
jgi:hypothetical protein